LASAALGWDFATGQEAPLSFRKASATHQRRFDKVRSGLEDIGAPLTRLILGPNVRGCHTVMIVGRFGDKEVCLSQPLSATLIDDVEGAALAKIVYGQLERQAALLLANG